MDKENFLRKYRHDKPRKITVCFNEEYFKNNTNLIFSECSLQDFRNFYTPWHQKGGVINGNIEEVQNDKEYRTVKVSEVMNFLDKKEKINSIIKKGLPTDIWEVPIATDIGLNKSLILDSNKTIVALVQDKVKLNEKIKIIEIRGCDLSKLVPDFEIISRELCMTQ